MPATTAPAGPMAGLVALQRAAGNRAVSRLLVQRATPGCGCTGACGCGTNEPGDDIVQRVRDGLDAEVPARERPAKRTAAAAPARPDGRLFAGLWRDDERAQRAVRNSPPLRAGDDRRTIAKLQEALADQGISMARSLVASGGFDGVWGDETTAAVRHFQEQAGVHPVGGWEAGFKTLSALDQRLLNRGQQPSNDLPAVFGAIVVQRDLQAPGTQPKAPAAPSPAAWLPFRRTLRTSVSALVDFLVAPGALHDERVGQVVEEFLAAEFKATFGKKDDQKEVGTLVEWEQRVSRTGRIALADTSVARLRTLTGANDQMIQQALARLDSGQSARRDRQADQAEALLGADARTRHVTGKVATTQGGRPRERLPAATAVPDAVQALLLLKLLQQYTQLPLDQFRALADDGLDQNDLAQITKGNELRAFLVDYFVTLVDEHKATLGPVGPANVVIERVVEQVAWGNPNAQAAHLHIGMGSVLGSSEAKPGIVFKPTGELYYDKLGAPLHTVGGLKERDPGFAGIPGAKLEIDIDDPALRSLFLSLKKMGQDPAVMVVGAERYWQDRDEVKASVLKKLPGKVLETLGETVAALAVFLGFKGLATILKTVAHPAAKAIGVLIDGLLLAAEWYFNVDFVDTTIERLVAIGNHLMRAVKDENGVRTELGKSHFEEATDLTARMVSEIGTQLALSFGLHGYKGKKGKAATTEFMKDAKAGEPTKLKCTFCELGLLGRVVQKGFQAVHAGLTEANIGETNRLRKEAGLPPLKPERLPGGRIKPNDPRFPSIEIAPDGTVSGKHRDVVKLNQEAGLTGKRREGKLTAESHHVLEDNFFSEFKVDREEALAVSLEAGDHAEFTTWMEAHRSERGKLDIHELFDLHNQMYQEYGAPELSGLLRRSIAENRAHLIDLYIAGDVPTANLPDFAARRTQALKFLRSL